MKKKKVISLVSSLKYNPDNQTFYQLKDYFSNLDSFLRTKWHKKLTNILKKSDNIYTALLLSELSANSQEDSELVTLVSEAEINNKEFEEIKYFNEQIKDYIHLEIMYDLCAGNGLNGFYNLYNNQSRFVHFYDIKENQHFEKLARHFSAYDYHLKDIHQTKIISRENSGFTSIHACNNLTDRVIEIAISNRKPFAVMPCCYEYHNNDHFSPELIDYFKNKEDAIDAARVKYIQDRDYTAIIRNIPEEITKKNRILIGLPT